MAPDRGRKRADRPVPTDDTRKNRVRPGRNYARWRALSLSLVYVVFALHILHWKITGKTLAPLELNEVMYTLELGVITAGFLFMCFLVLGTLLFGRFFCSWACHIMVLQDLCAWLLRKVGIRAKPIRSRLLLWVPPLTAFYMFIWPQIVRAWRNKGFPTFQMWTDAEGWASFVTTNFWRNLPTPWIIVLTFLVCGFAIVYLLGSRTFCVYVCPYGAVFSLADRLSPGRILVDRDKCQQCGTCTEVCTSAVRVHEDVKRYGMIVNPACLKDLDCVSNCPQQALRYRFSRPALFKSNKAGGRFGLPYDFSVAEEVLMSVVFVTVLLSFRGLYSRVPFLLSLALGVIVGVFCVTAARLITRSEVSLSTLNLKRDGRLTLPGGTFALFFAVLTAFVAHSGFVRYHEFTGLRQVRALAGVEDDAQAGLLAERAVAHLSAAERWGLFNNERVERSMVTALLRLKRYEQVEAHAKGMLERVPGDSWVRLRLGHALAAAGRPGEAEQQFRLIIAQWADETEDIPSAAASAHEAVAMMLGRRGDYVPAAHELQQVIALDPDRATAHAQLGGLLAEIGQYDGAVASLRAALKLDPKLAGVRYNLGTVLAHLNRWAEAVAMFEEAVAESPEDAELHNNLGFALARTGRADQAVGCFERALALDPQHADAHFNLARTLTTLGRIGEAAQHLQEAARLDPRYAPLLTTPESGPRVPAAVEQSQPD